MARGKYLWDEDTQTWQPAHIVRAKRAAKAPDRRSLLPTPGVIGSMEPIMSMADGRVYDDKRSYYKSLARHNCEVVGFDKNWTDYVANPVDDKAHEADVVADVKKAIEIENSK